MCTRVRIEAQSCVHVHSSVCVCCFFLCVFFFHTSAAAEFPGKSEHIQKEKEGGSGVGWRVQINKFVEKGRGAGERIRREEGEEAGRKTGEKEKREFRGVKC